MIIDNDICYFYLKKRIRNIKSKKYRKTIYINILKVQIST